MTDFIRDDNGDYHITNGSNTFVRDPNGDFHLEPNASDFVNDGTSTLNAKSINSDGGKFTTDGSGNLTIGGSYNMPNFSISQKEDTSGHSGIVLQYKDINHIDIFGGNLDTNRSLDFTNQNARSFYVWPIGPTGEFNFGFATSTTINNALVITQSNTTINNDLMVSGDISTTTTGVIYPSVVTSSSGANTTYSFDLPENGIYSVKIVTVGQSSTEGNVCQQGFNDFSIWVQDSGSQVQSTINEQSYTSFGNVTHFSVAMSASGKSIVGTCTATDGNTAGTWTWTSRVEWTKVV